MTGIPYPNLFLAGAPKCGTTSLADWLAQHPDIFAPPVKEPVFFAGDLTAANPHMSEQAYLELYRQRDGEAYAVDASTHNFYSGVAAERIARVNPNARIVIMLRNPADAVYSLFHQLRFNGSEELDDFEASLAAEEGRAKSPMPLRRGYPETLLYTRVYDFSENIARYVEQFGVGQMKVLLLDDVRDDPRAAFRSLLEWLSLDPAVADRIDYQVSNPAKKLRTRFFNDLAVYPPKWAGIAKSLLSRETSFRLRKLIWNANTVPQANPPLDPALRGLLVERFESQVRWLENFLQRDLTHWQ